MWKQLCGALLLLFLAILSEALKFASLYKCTEFDIATNWTRIYTLPEGLMINSINDKVNKFTSTFITLESAKSKQLTCPTTSTETHEFREFHWHAETTQHESNVFLYQDETLVWYKDENEHYCFPKHRFCISYWSDYSVTFRTCALKCSALGANGTSLLLSSMMRSGDVTKCIRKCCPLKQVLSRYSDGHDGHMKCKIEGPGWWNKRSDLSQNSTNNKTVIATQPINNALFGFRNCSNLRRIEFSTSSLSPSSPSSVKILEDGTLRYQNTLSSRRDRMEITTLKNYCVDTHKDPFVFKVIWCGDKKAEVTRKILDWRNNPFIIICNSISLLFLFATLVHLVKRPYKDKIQNSLGLWYVSTVLGAMFPMTIYKLWSTTQFGAPDDIGLRSWTLCMLAAWSTVYFTFLAYFALTTLMLDLNWRIISSLLKEGKRFRIPVCGVLLVVVPIVILAGVVSSSQLGRGDEGFCFTELRLFHVPPLNCIAGIAVTFSLLATIAMNLDLKDEKISARSKIVEVQICASINMRLSFIMGFLYFSDLAFEVPRRITPFDKTDMLIWMFAPADVINGLLGVFVFLIYLAAKFQINKMKVSSDSNFEAVNIDAAAVTAGTTMPSQL